ncbi:MAG: chemotaxis response regulator protein-glutamate methylesterase [Deltaproteobacteria bacterium]|nr:chemotaxis response regulator protein-glutamate methylesterase [Deltaproteobacteria bacterium]
MQIKVLIVDDSNFMRKALSKLIASDPMCNVVGMASNGEECLKKLKDLSPDVVTLDVEMEGMDGLTTLKKIMDDFPTPVIMFSAHTKKGAEVTLKSLQEGAVDFMEKPSGSISMDLGAVRDELIGKLKIAAKVKPKRRTAASAPATAAEKGSVRDTLRLVDVKNSIVAIGSSTGGVQALHNIIPKLSMSLPVPVLVVQHMPPLFTKSLAESLDSDSMVTVKEAEEGDVLKPAHVYIAPGGLHMTVRKAKDEVCIHLDKHPENELLRPSVDVMFRSVASVYGKNTLAIVLTGMGNDGTSGMKELKAKGALSIAQSEATCVVYGMPKFIVDQGMADIVLPINMVADQIESAVKARGQGV